MGRRWDGQCQCSVLLKVANMSEWIWRIYIGRFLTSAYFGESNRNPMFSVHGSECMSLVSPVFHTAVTVNKKS